MESEVGGRGVKDMVDTNSLQQGFSGASLMRGAFRVSRLRTLFLQGLSNYVARHKSRVTESCSFLTDTVCILGSHLTIGHIRP